MNSKENIKNQEQLLTTTKSGSRYKGTSYAHYWTGLDWVYVLRKWKLKKYKEFIAKIKKIFEL